MRHNCCISGEQEVVVDDRTYLVAYECSGYAVYRPARVNGPPENCWPDESECEIVDAAVTSISDDDGNPVDDNAIWLICIQALNTDKIRDQLWDQFMQRRHDGDPDAYDHWRDDAMIWDSDPQGSITND